MHVHDRRVPLVEGPRVINEQPEKILIFLKNGKNSKIVEMVEGSLKFFFKSWMMKRTSPLDSSRKI